MHISESTENYLECIYMLSEKGEVHSVMIAKELGVTKATVSHTVKMLRENGFITVDGENHIRLTVPGLKIAKGIYERHALLVSFLMGIGVSAATAEEDACRIEHDISDETFDAIRSHTDGKQDFREIPFHDR